MSFAWASAAARLPRGSPAPPRAGGGYHLANRAVWFGLRVLFARTWHLELGPARLGVPVLASLGPLALGLAMMAAIAAVDLVLKPMAG